MFNKMLLLLKIINKSQFNFDAFIMQHLQPLYEKTYNSIQNIYTNFSLILNIQVLIFTNYFKNNYFLYCIIV